MDYNLNTPATQGRGTAPTTTTNQAVITNNSQVSQSMEIDIAVDDNGAATNLLLVEGPTPTWAGTRLGATKADQTHIVMSGQLGAGTATGKAEIQAMLAVGLHITRIEIWTDNPTDVFNGKLIWAEMPINGYPQPNEISLQRYAKSLGGGGYDNTLVIADKPLGITKTFFMYLTAIPASTNVKITLYSDFIGNALLGNKIAR